MRIGGQELSTHIKFHSLTIATDSQIVSLLRWSCTIYNEFVIRSYFHSHTDTHMHQQQQDK